jgi:hypothetical protein
MNTTLYSHLKPKSPGFASLKKKYNPVLELVNLLIGTIPNCDLIMEIWPTSFKTYNLLVPNLLNLPLTLFGSKSVKSLMGLAMYHSSSSAGCNYCTAHCCTFALRRGLDESIILGTENPKESAVINFSRKMSEIPCTITQDDFKELQKYCNPKEVEAVSMGVVLMGFLNKFMDVIGVELEQAAIDDVGELLGQTGWKAGKHFEGEVKKSENSNLVKKDSLPIYLKTIRQAPGAIHLENKWTKGVPSELNKINTFLNNEIGHSFSILSKLKRKKLLKALATVLKDNFSASNSLIGLREKIISGLIFSKVVDNTYLENELLILAKKNAIEIDEEFHAKITAFSKNNSSNVSDLKQQASHFELSEQEIIRMKFVQQASSSPVVINEVIKEEIIKEMPAESIVELVTLLSLLQTLHRLDKLPLA